MSRKTIGRFEIKDELGRGGMATVFHAYDPRFKRHVAIKVLPRQFTHDPMFRARFEREAQTIASLEHAAIVPVYDFGQEGDQPYLVMRYMSGGSLASRIEAGSMSVVEATKVLRRIAAALDEAHRLGIVHRDLKPDNILFDQQGQAYLSDFGIVKLTSQSKTFTGQSVVGTPAYMSPEQARGLIELDGRSDVYTLGVVLFEMLTGELPYQSDTPLGMAMMHVNDPIPLVRDFNADLPPDIQNIVDGAMAKARIDRYDTAGQLAEAMTTVAREEYRRQRELAPPPPPPKPNPPQEAIEAHVSTPARAVTPVRKATPPQQATPERLPVSAAIPGPKRDDREQNAPMWILWVAVGVVVFGALILTGLNILSRDGGPTAIPGIISDESTRTSVVVELAEDTVTPTWASPIIVPTETQTPAPTAVNTATATPSYTPTRAPSRTPTPTIAATATATESTVAGSENLAEVRVIESSINVRRGPGTLYESVKFLSRDDIVRVLARNEDETWYVVELPDGTPGWVSASVVEPVNDTAVNTVRVALTIPAPPSRTPMPTVTPTVTPGAQPPASNGGGGSGGDKPDPPGPAPANPTIARP